MHRTPAIRVHLVNDGETHGKSGTLTHLGLDFDISVVSLNHFFDQRQSEPRTGDMPGRLAFNPIKTIEDVGEYLQG